MSFFVSESLKGIISEEDLAADSPIKVVEAKTELMIHFYNEDDESFKCELLEMRFCNNHDKIKIQLHQENIGNIFNCVNKKVDYSIFLNNTQYLERSGTLVLDKLEVNKEDNYITCKIDMFKRG